jgi:hypothetical protein
VEGTPQVKRNAVPKVVLDPGRESLISSSGALLLKGLTGIDRRDPFAGTPWHKNVPARVEAL